MSADAIWSIASWKSLTCGLSALSTATVRRNADLENRVGELEVELLVWKQAHAAALEASERDIKAHNVQIAALNRQISNMDNFKNVRFVCVIRIRWRVLTSFIGGQNQNALILCIINGDELIFDREFLVQGYHGGRAAAQQLTQSIAEQLSTEEVQVYGRLSFWITIYLNKAEVSEDLAANNICSQEQFHGFLTVRVFTLTEWYNIDAFVTRHPQGFTQSSPRFLTVDVGQNKDALEAKIKG